MSKSRYWAFIIYPESAIKDWEQILSEKGVVFAVSPLHDKDINPDGEPKKPHYHVLVEFEGPTTYKNVKENICDEVLGTIPKKVISLRGYYRYLTHMDNPEKAQYEAKDIKEFGGFRLELTNTETIQLKMQILEDIREKMIIEYKDLIDYYLELGDIDRLDLASHNTFFFDKYISSGRNKLTIEKNKSKIQSERQHRS